MAFNFENLKIALLFAAGAALISCQTADEVKYASPVTKLELVKSKAVKGGVDICVKNISNKNIAVLTWFLPTTDQFLPTDFFEITTLSGKEVEYRGMYECPLAFCAADYTILKPNEAIVRTTVLSDSYNVKANTPYLVTYTYKPEGVVFDSEKEIPRFLRAVRNGKTFKGRAVYFGFDGSPVERSNVVKVEADQTFTRVR